jgi:zona occludens toxin (predicted ATPase)
MKPVKWLAALPVVAFFSGGWLSSVAPTFVLGMPFLMVWNVSWLVLTSLIMVVIDRAEGDLDAADAANAAITADAAITAGDAR